MKFILLISFLIPSLAFADPISGQLKSTNDEYPAHLGPPTEDLIPYVTLEVGQKLKFSRSWKAQWKVFALTNLASKYPPENAYGDVPEAFVETRSGTKRLRMGMNTVNWAVVDVSSPSDVVDTTALFHPLRTRKQGAPMIEAQVGPESFNLDLVYIPIQREPLLPSKDSRWLPREFLVNASTGGFNKVTIPRSLEYEYDRSETLDRALNNNYGAKLASHLGNWDLQITHFEGAAPMPKIHALVNLTSGSTADEVVALSPIHIQPVNYRVRTTGFGFVWAREKWIFRGESAYQHTISQSRLLQPWSWTSVLAAETNLSVGSSTMIVLAQLYYTKNPQESDNFVASSYRLFDHTGVLGARWMYSDNLTLMLSSLYEPQTQGAFVQAGFEQKLSENLNWGLSWQNFSAQKDGLLKTFAKDSHGTLQMTYFF